jgi:hypothetical protein
MPCQNLALNSQIHPQSLVFSRRLAVKNSQHCGKLRSLLKQNFKKSKKLIAKSRHASCTRRAETLAGDPVSIKPSLLFHPGGGNEGGCK